MNPQELSFVGAVGSLTFVPDTTSVPTLAKPAVFAQRAMATFVHDLVFEDQFESFWFGEFLSREMDRVNPEKAPLSNFPRFFEQLCFHQRYTGYPYSNLSTGGPRQSMTVVSIIRPRP